MDDAVFRRYITTEKQRQFETDFFKDAATYEVWEEIDFSDDREVGGARTFEIKAEDIISYSRAVEDDNPLMNDEEYAKNSAYGGLVPHPLFATQIIFWCIGEKERGNWIRTPGARNPGQSIEIYENFRVGEVIHLKMKPYDRYIKRGKCYLKYEIVLYNQDEVKKARCIGTLILPKSREDLERFLRGERGVEV